jgi:hypothetical protein
MRRTGISLSVGAAALLCACGSANTAAQPSHTASPKPIPDAHELTFQPADIPKGFAPHQRAILTIDTTTVVSEKLLTDGSVLTRNGFRSGAEYGWERPSDHKMAAESVVMVFASHDGAYATFNAVADTLKAYMTENADSAMFGDSEFGFHQGDLSLALVQQGSIVFLVQTSDASLQGDVDLAMTLDKRLQQYGGLS